MRVLCSLGIWSLLLLGAVASPPGPADERDSDQDGLSDFGEVHKYFTDPQRADSDGDGIPDGDWHERREYTYSVRAVLRVLKPINQAVLNDDYQDARVLQETEEYVELEVICYPRTTIAETLVGTKDWRPAAAQQTEGLKSTLTANWDEAMRADLLGRLRQDGLEVETMTDVELASKVSAWLLKHASYKPMFCSYYCDFPEGRFRIFPGLEAAFQRGKGSPGWSVKEQLQHETFGKGMYQSRCRGSCTSSAIYLTTGLRAAGLPTRMVLAIPIVDANDPAQRELVEKNLRRVDMREHLLEQLPAQQSFSAHTFNEVFVAGRWHRLNYNALGANIDSSFGLMVHVNTFYDLSEAQLAPSWGRRYGLGEHSDTFPTANPYTTLEVADRRGIHATSPLLVEKPEITVSEITIESTTWWHALPADDWRRKSASPGRDWRDTSKAGHLLLHVSWPGDKRLDPGKLGRLLQKADRAMTLAAPNGDRIPLEIRLGSVWTREAGQAELEIAIPESLYRQMRADVEYALLPSNAQGDLRWQVAPGLKVKLAPAKKKVKLPPAKK